MKMSPRRLLDKLLGQKPARLRKNGSQLRRCRFYQFRSGTAKFFFHAIGRTDIRVEDTPHFALALALSEENPERVSKAENWYREYLIASWGSTRSEDLDRRIAEFKSHFEAFKNGRLGPPVTLTEIDGDFFVADGNHRCAFAAVLDQPIICTLEPFPKIYKTGLASREFYGTGNRGIPYQTVYLGNREIIPGRRNDLHSRFSMIPPAIIEGATILDIASNIGMSSLMAAKNGALQSLGLELSGSMVRQATRLAMFEDLYPQAEFLQFDLDKDDLSPDSQFDVAFAFSIYNHLKHPDRLTDLISKHIKNAVIFEGHPATGRSDYRDFFDSGLFSSIEEIGMLPESKFKELRNRPLWLCRRNETSLG